ncbi:MAG: alpha/beta fold hydrolase, partial [Bacteroidia bacterium]
MNYKEYGSGEPLLILHGFMGSLDNWHTLASKFGQSFRTFAIDQRNHGKSFHTETHSLQLMVDDLKEFISYHQLKNVNLLGHSMGGKVVMEFALQYPELTNKIIVADIAPRKYKPGHDDVFAALHAVDLSKIETRKQAEEAMIPYLPDFGVRQFVLKNLDRTETGEYKWKMNLRVLYRDYEEVNKEIEGNRSFENPVLFLKGA